MNTTMLPALGRMATRAQFFVYLLGWNPERGKFDKKPIGSPADAQMTYAQAHAEAMRLRSEGQHATVGLWVTKESGLYFLDVDKLPELHKTSPLANELLTMLPGAFVEWSSSERGIHIVGTLATPVAHSNRNEALHLEFYTADRGIALNIDGAQGGCLDTAHDVSALVQRYFPPRAESQATERRAEWRGPSDDDELIRRALAARDSAAVTLGGKPSFAQLWAGMPDKNSDNDAALAMRLAFWTGCDADRMARLMWRSGMVRDKWRQHRTYLDMTIASACAACAGVYQEPAAAANALETASQTSELSNAHRLLRSHGDDLLAVEGMGWHVWQEHGPWKRDHRAAYRLAFGLGKVIQSEADELEAWVNDETVFGSAEQEERAKVQAARARWAKYSEGRTVITNTLALLESYLHCDAKELDASPTLVGCPGGVIDLAAGAMRAHRREDRITKTVAVDYDSSAQAPAWTRFLADILPDAKLREYVQSLAGYALSGKRGEHLLPVFYGTGANGKSTFLTVLQALLSDYAGVAAPGLLISKGGNEHPTALASLQGKRLIVVSETGEGGRLNEEQVKLLTGGDRITARFMRQDFFEFEATHLIILQTNHKPRVTGNDEGIWRRVKLIPFTVTVPPEKRDPELTQKLLRELPGILAWAVEGFRMYQREGFKEPEAVRVATAEYRTDSDHVGAFLAERCIVSPERTATASELYANYQNWCALSGERPLSQRTLALRLAEREGLQPFKGTGGVRTWLGVGIDHAAPLRLVK